jgi:hypothetical protein
VKTVKKTWTWADYELSSSPIISLDDYRIKAYGRDEEIAAFVDELARYSRKSTRMLRRLVAFWGSGKSTYLYNICFNVNNRLFFGDEAENPKDGNFTHTLAFFEKLSVKRVKLLDCVYNDGLPWPWDTTTSKSLASEKGGEAWKECLRKLAFIILRKAVYDVKIKHLEEAALGGSKLRKDVYQNILSLEGVKTSEFIQEVVELQKKNDQILEECGELMRFYIRMLLPSIEIKKGNRKIVNQDIFEQQFPQFLYPPISSKFLAAYNELFHEADVNLRYFPAFEKVLKAAQTFLLVVFDEVEDWGAVAREKIDDDLHDIVVDAESPLSLILIFRTDALRYINKMRTRDETIGTYMTIYDRLDNVRMQPLEAKSVVGLTAEILSTARDGEPRIFPLTESFIEKLGQETKRGGSFNIRTYLRALNMLLKESLNWKREKPELTEDILKEKKTDAIIKEAIRAEQAEATRFIEIEVPKRLEE